MTATVSSLPVLTPAMHAAGWRLQQRDGWWQFSDDWADDYPTRSAALAGARVTWTQLHPEDDE